MGRHLGAARGGTVAVAVIGLLVVGGCGGTAGPEEGADVEDIQEDPIFNSFSEAENFAGQQVEVNAEVSEVLTPKAFTIADESGEALLVVYDGSPQVSINTQVRVSGTVHKRFSIGGVTEEVGASIDEAAFDEDFKREPYIEADAIDTPPFEDAG